MPIQVVTLATGPSACLDSRTRPDLADAGSLCGPGNCSGSARDERDDRAGERSLWTEGSAVCPVRLHASCTVTGRALKIQGLRALDRYEPSTWVTQWTEDMGNTYRADLRRVRALEGNVTRGTTPRVRAGVAQAREWHGRAVPSVRDQSQDGLPVRGAVPGRGVGWA